MNSRIRLIEGFLGKFDEDEADEFNLVANYILAHSKECKKGSELEWSSFEFN